jgi:hypothetical protein
MARHSFAFSAFVDGFHDKSIGHDCIVLPPTGNVKPSSRQVWLVVQ